MRNQSVDEYGAIVLGPMSKTQNHDGQDWRDYHAIPYHRPNQGRINVNNLNEIEIALRDGMINELKETTEKSIDIIQRLADIIRRYESTIAEWENQNTLLVKLCKEIIEERDRARDTAVRLEQECHSCADTVHHGNEEVYDGAI
jgi:chromosome segregation ATPase